MLTKAFYVDQVRGIGVHGKLLRCCVFRIMLVDYVRNPPSKFAQSRHGIAAGRKEAKEIILVQARPSIYSVSVQSRGTGRELEAKMKGRPMPQTDQDPQPLCVECRKPPDGYDLGDVWCRAIMP